MIELVAQAWHHRSLILAFIVAFLIAMLKREHEAKIEYKRIAAEKPLIEKSEEKLKDRRIERGPKKITNTYTTVPGKCEPVIVAQVIEIAPEVEEIHSHVSKAEKETPICPAPESKNRWLIGASFTPEDSKALPIVRGGYSWGNRVDLTYGYASRKVGGHAHLIEVTTRWGGK